MSITSWLSSEALLDTLLMVCDFFSESVTFVILDCLLALGSGL